VLVRLPGVRIFNKTKKQGQYLIRNARCGIQIPKREEVEGPMVTPEKE